MRIWEFIDKHYTEVISFINDVTADPVRMVLENDDLPYDDVRMCDGQLQKVVLINDDDEFIPVMDLLQHNKEEIEAMPDCDFKRLYQAYMSNVKIDDVNLEKMRTLIRAMHDKEKERVRLLNV